jgi:uncharacterized protein
VSLDLLVVIGAIALGSFVKGVTGTGLPQIAIPVMATSVGVEHAVVVMAVPGIASNAWQVWANRDAARETRDLPSVTAAGVVGCVAGTVVLSSVDARLLSVVLAVVILCYVLVVLRRPDVSLAPSVSRYTSPPVGFLAGGLQGSTGVSGPLLTTYLHGYALSPAAYVLSLSVLFLAFSTVQVVSVAALGLYTADRLRDSLLALVPIAVMLPLGSRLSRRLPTAVFRRVVLAGLAVTACSLLVNALRG